MIVGFLTRYSNRGASSRVRALQFADALKTQGLQSRFLPLLSDRYIDELYRGRRAWGEVLVGYGRRLRQVLTARQIDLIWIEKELLPYAPAWLELGLLGGRPYVMDIDDAIFHLYEESPRWLVRRMYGHKIDTLFSRARVVTAGNRYLSARAVNAGACSVELVPSVVPLSRYPARPSAKRSPPGALRIAWIGSPATVRYLELVRRPLAVLSRSTNVELRVIGAAAPAWKGVTTVGVPWSLETEANSIADCDVGIMPLPDAPWEHGKCGYKLVQYMACGLPVVASRLGANKDLVAEGEDGFLVESEDEWVTVLAALAIDPSKRQAFGASGRRKVELNYSVEAIGPKLARLFAEAAG